MKRLPLLFTVVVWAAFVTLFLVQRAADGDPYAGLEFDGLEGETLGVLETPRGPHRLAGRVQTGDGSAAEDVLVELESVEPPRPGSLWSARTDSEGAFAFERLPPGNYAAWLAGSGRPSVRYETAVPATVRWQLPAPYPEPATLPRLEHSTLSGTLAPPVGWSLETHPLAGFEVVFEPSGDADPLSGALRRRAQADAYGEFRFDELVHGTYDIYVLPPWAVDGDWPRLSEESRRHGGDERPVSLRLRSGALDVRVEHGDGAAVPGAFVQVWPRDRPDRIWPLATTGPEGAASVEHLPPAFYVVRVHAGDAVVEHEVEVRIGQRAQLVLDDWSSAVR